MERVRFVLALVLGLGLAGFACGGPGGSQGDDDDIQDDDGENCSDQDGDGYGAGSDCLGDDCNDSVPDIHTPDQCEQFCDDVGNMGPGCPCDAVEPEICYFGPPETLGQGACRAGIMACDGGVWSSCDGQQLPGTEICDGADNDCDTEVDEGVQSACGDCNFDCEESCFGVGEGCEDFDPDAEGAQGVVGTPEGGITLDGETSIRNYVIWIANSSEGTVSKINTRTREEEGRYATGPAGGGGFGGGGAWLSPSRTTVNYNGDVAVANRGGNGELSRFNASDCPDGDGDGRVETSEGRGDVYAWEEDECLIWSTPVAVGLRGSGFEIRLGLDGVVEEFVWSGSTSSSIIYEVEAESGELTGREIPGVYPYGLAMGPDNKLWTFNGWAGGAPGLVEVTTTDDDLEKTVHGYPAGESQYGITVDNVGRVWIGGSTARYDPEADEWEGPPAEVYGGGIACDAEGNAYTGELGAFGGGGDGPWKIDAETMEIENIAEGGGHGWAVDFDGYIWAVEFVGSNAYVYDPDSLDLDFTFTDLVGAYTYSDMTGFQLVNATNPVGIYPVIFEACEDGEDPHWVDLTWEAVVPAGTQLGFSFKTANDLPGLAAATLQELGTVPPSEAPISIEAALEAADLAPGRLLYIEVTLQSISREDAPILNSVSVSHSCDIPIG